MYILIFSDSNNWLLPSRGLTNLSYNGPLAHTNNTTTQKSHWNNASTLNSSRHNSCFIQCMNKQYFSNSSCSRNNSSDKTNKLSSISTSVDDFRAREEQREKEEDAKEQQQSSENNKDEKIDQIRSNILNAALPFVIEHGWSRDSIVKGAESIGYPGVVHGMFPNGAIELINHFYMQSNQQLIRQLKDTENISANKSEDEIVAFVTQALKLRLQLIEPYMKHWPQALALMSLPPNVPTSLAQLLTLIDDICFYAGDRSVDVSINIWKLLF